MFKKPLAHQSNATPLRSSARRQLINSVLEQYPALLGSQSGGDDEDTLKVSEKGLGKLIVPEGIRSGTIETSDGVDGVSGSGQSNTDGSLTDFVLHPSR